MGSIFNQFPNAFQQMARPMMPAPLQRLQMIQQAMQNPAAFVKERFPDIPDQIMNNPNQILQYIQQSRGISNQQINQLCQTYGQR